MIGAVWAWLGSWPEPFAFAWLCAWSFILAGAVFYAEAREGRS